MNSQTSDKHTTTYTWSTIGQLMKKQLNKLEVNYCTKPITALTVLMQDFALALTM